MQSSWQIPHWWLLGEAAITDTCPASAIMHSMLSILKMQQGKAAVPQVTTLCLC